MLYHIGCEVWGTNTTYRELLAKLLYEFTGDQLDSQIAVEIDTFDGQTPKGNFKTTTKWVHRPLIYVKEIK